MTQRLTLSATLLLGAAMLLGATLLSGCGYDPDVGPRAETQSSRPAPAPGSFAVHMNGEISSSVTVSR
jgi:hypothetical protein